MSRTTWTGTVRVRPATPARSRRDGQVLMRHEKPYNSGGRVEALTPEGIVAWWQSFDVYPDFKVVLLVEANTGASGSEDGRDYQGQGAGKAMLDELDRLFPEPDWWMASADGGHSPPGIGFMRSRPSTARRKIHTETCAVARCTPCTCDWLDPR